MKVKTYLLIGFIIVTVVVLIIAALLKSGIQPVVPQPVVANPDSNQESRMLKGVSISPKSFTSADFVSFWAEAASIGDTITWSGSIEELNEKGGAPYIMTQFAVQNELEPVMVFQVYDRATNKLFPAVVGQEKEVTIKALKDFMANYDVKYVAIGIEVNQLYEQNSSEFDRYVELFNELNAAIKEVSPTAVVFPTFQYERLQGLRGGLFGGKIEPESNDWSLLSRFESADLIGLTTYPGLIYPVPSLIPDDYYSEIGKKTKKSVAFIEVGWSHDTIAKDWESTPQMQQAFIAKFKKDMQKLNVRMIIWSFLYDQDTVAPFQYMGLRSKTDAEKTGSELEWAQ